MRIVIKVGTSTLAHKTGRLNIQRVEELVKKNMENAYNGRVALTVSAGVGNNWLEAH